MSREVPEDISVYHAWPHRVRYSLPSIFMHCWSRRPDVTISTLSHLNLYLLCGKFLFPSNMRVLIREANTASISLDSTARPQIYRFLYRRQYPRSDKVICSSNYMRNDLIKNFGIPPQKIAVIPNPVDTAKIKTLCHSQNNPYRPGKIHVVAVGWLIHQKGFDLLLRSFEYAARQLPELHLTIVGDGPQREPLTHMAEDLGIGKRVSFVGHKDNPYLYMANANLFVSSSRWEGLPNAVLESLACGTPVIAFDCPGGTSEIVRDGKNGWLVPAEDWTSMGRKVVAVVRSKKWKGLKSTQLLPEEFDCFRVVRMYEELLRDSRN
jgi:glycosyltransferase involved in cell wall biosynthesis